MTNKNAVEKCKEKLRSGKATWAIILINLIVIIAINIIPGIENNFLLSSDLKTIFKDLGP